MNQCLKNGLVRNKKGGKEVFMASYIFMNISSKELLWQYYIDLPDPKTSGEILKTSRTASKMAVEELLRKTDFGSKNLKITLELMILAYDRESCVSKFEARNYIFSCMKDTLQDLYDRLYH